MSNLLPFPAPEATGDEHQPPAWLNQIVQATPGASAAAVVMFTVSGPQVAWTTMNTSQVADAGRALNVASAATGWGDDVAQSVTDDWTDTLRTRSRAAQARASYERAHPWRCEIAGCHRRFATEAKAERHEARCR